MWIPLVNFVQFHGLKMTLKKLSSLNPPWRLVKKCNKKSFLFFIRHNKNCERAAGVPPLTTAHSLDLGSLIFFEWSLFCVRCLNAEKLFTPFHHIRGSLMDIKMMMEWSHSHICTSPNHQNVGDPFSSPQN